MRLSLMMLALLGLVMVSCTGQPQFKGRDFSYGPAPDFRLADQDSQLVSLSDQRGKVVVLTFMYTNCRDVCPLTAAGRAGLRGRPDHSGHSDTRRVSYTWLWTARIDSGSGRPEPLCTPRQVG
jgi:cytochrome oxidase Cu insertion factor (SCO1/SenC/PrrC family)